jgi:leader peptidase (prepilin peptidase)/N-methyltransferase
MIQAIRGGHGRHRMTGSWVVEVRASIGDDARVTATTWMWTAAAVLIGVAAATVLRAAVFHHSVPAGDPWRTACPHCATPLVRPGCGRRIGPPAAVVELLAALVLGVLAWAYAGRTATVALIWAGLVAVVLGLVDVAVHRLPDRLVLAAVGGTVAVFAVGAFTGGDARRLVTAVACGLGCGAVYFVLVFAVPRGMGLGDAKLAVLVGLVSGWFGVRTAVFALVAGVFLAGVAAIALLATGRVTRTSRVAHGPFMLLGALVAIVLATRLP